MLTKEDITVTIHTLRQGLPLPPFPADPDDPDDEDDYDEDDGDDVADTSVSDVAPDPDEKDEDDEDGPEEIEIMSEGRLVTTSRRVEIVYEEGELTGMEGSTTKIGFDRDFPDLITMLRSGPVNTALVFEPDRRHICVYQTPFSSFEVCVQTLDVQNRLLLEGELDLDYIIEIHGARTERCKLNLKIRKTDHDD